MASIFVSIPFFNDGSGLASGADSVCSGSRSCETQYMFTEGGQEPTENGRYAKVGAAKRAQADAGDELNRSGFAGGSNF